MIQLESRNQRPSGDDGHRLANRRASRAEEIEAHGKQIQFRSAIQKSKKVYDRNRLKRAAIKSHTFCYTVISYQCAYLKAHYPKIFLKYYRKHDL